MSGGAPSSGTQRQIKQGLPVYLKNDHTNPLKGTLKKLNKGSDWSHGPKKKLKILGPSFKVFFRLEAQWTFLESRGEAHRVQQGHS